MKKTYNIYCDMDGVIADFNRPVNAVARFETEKDFFYNLQPIKHNLQAISKLIENGYNVYILSASPNDRCDNDKRRWLAKYLPNLKPTQIIIMRNGQNKADFVRTFENNILFDDYHKNIRDFENRGFKGYQIKKYYTIQRYVNQIN